MNAAAARSSSLGSLLGARHIAVVGATENNDIGVAAQHNLRRAGYSGRVSQVHPKYATVAGLPVVPSLTDLDEAPDVVLVVTGAKAIPSILAQAESIGVPFAVIPGAGDNEAAEHAQVVADFLKAPERTIRAFGPNCMGFVAVQERVMPYIGTVPDAVRPGSAAIISQSGAVVETIIAQGHRVGWRLLASTGNEANITSEDVIEHLLDEGQTTTILLSQEGVKQPSRYFRLLRRAAEQDVAVGIVRVGRSPISQAAALTHTGAITGDWDLWARLARREGAAVLDTLDELLEFGALTQTPSRRPQSSRFFVVTNSGGQGSQIADVLVPFSHIEIPPHSAAFTAAFAEVFPHASAPSNPTDLWGLADWQTAYAEGFSLIAQHAEEGTLIASIDGSPFIGDPEVELAKGIIERANSAAESNPKLRALHFQPLHAGLHPEVKNAIVASETPSIKGAAGLRALGHVLAPTGPALPEARVEAMGAWSTEGERFEHAQALALLERHGVQVPKTAVVETPAQAAEAAQAFRAPLVVKAVGPAHRAKVGGVALGLHPDDVLGVATRMQAIPDCVGFEIVEQVSADLELLVHLAVDSQLGPRATLGVGGALTEQAGLAVVDLAPTSEAEARDLLRRTIGEQVDDEAAAVWTGAVAAALVGLAQALFAGEAAEIEINPLAIDRLGGRAIAIDVLARGEVT